MCVRIWTAKCVDMFIDMCAGKLSTEEKNQLFLAGIRTKDRDEAREQAQIASKARRRRGMVACTNACGNPAAAAAAAAAASPFLLPSLTSESPTSTR